MSDLNVSSTETNENARRILYAATSRVGNDLDWLNSHSALLYGQVLETLMEAIYYLNHGRYSKARTGYGACAFAFGKASREVN